MFQTVLRSPVIMVSIPVPTTKICSHCCLACNLFFSLPLPYCLIMGGTDCCPPPYISFTFSTYTFQCVENVAEKWETHGGHFFFACKDFGRMFDHSFPTCAVFFRVFCWFFFLVEISSHTFFILYAMVSPQWLIELRRLWPNVPQQVVSQLVSR